MPRILSRIWLLGLALLFTSSTLLAQSLPDFTGLVERNVPAIVNVSTTRQSSSMSGEQREELEEFLRYFYGDRLPDLDLPPPGELEQRGANGSGFIISSDGYVVTNHHVVDGAAAITITLNDLREFEAEVVGSDENSDLALLKIEAADLPAVRLGDSSQLRVGEWVLAIGSPFGLRYSVAAGIISYMGRSLPTGGRNYVSYIQTDVAINPGHSGGPLLNLEGEVIGINSQIFTDTGGSIGLSFAIPVDVASNVIAQLKEHGSVQRGWLGVQYEDVSQSLAEAFGLDTPHGALINRVIDDSPAQAAGLQEGDIVVGFDGERIRTGDDLPYFVGLVMPGSEVELQIVRDGIEQTLSLTLGALEPTAQVGAAEPEPANLLGLQVRALTAEERETLDVEQGVRILAVEGPAAEADLQEGDVVLSINNRPVGSAEDVRRLAPQLPRGKPIAVLVARGQSQNFYTLRVPE